MARDMEYSADGILRYSRCDTNYTNHVTPSGCWDPRRPNGIRTGAARQECRGTNAYAGCYWVSTFCPHTPASRDINRRFNSGIAGLDRRRGVPWGRNHNFGNQTGGDEGIDYRGRYMGNGSNRHGCRNGAGIDSRPEHFCISICPICSPLGLPS